MDNKENIFNDGSLINKNYETILNIIGDNLQRSRQIRSNRKKILKLLNETFLNLTEESLESSFSFIAKELPDLKLDSYSIKETNRNINKFSTYILATKDQYKDHGYTLLVIGYFWITKNFKQNS